MFPSSVNLMALPTRFTISCRSRVGSPIRSFGTLGDTRAQISRCFSSDPLSQRLQRIPEQIPNSEFGFLKFELARLDLGKIQNVVDDVQQAVRGRFDQAEIVPLLGRQSGVERQVRHADDAVHRRADFVAHVGQEFALGAAARFGRFLGLEQSRLRPFALGDVQKRDDCADGLALFADGIGPVFHRKTGAIRAPENFFVRMDSFATMRSELKIWHSSAG